MGINQRVSLRKFVDDIRRWVEEGRSDEWIASALGTSPSSVQSFRSRNAIYRRGAGSTLHDPEDYASYEGVLDEEGPGVWFDPAVGDDPRGQKRFGLLLRRHLSRIDENSEWPPGTNYHTRDNMAFVGVLSTQLWHREFVQGATVASDVPYAVA